MPKKHDCSEPSLNDEQVGLGAAFACHVLGRTWFDDLLGQDEQPVAKLLLGVFVCFESGVLPTKTQAMQFLNAVDARTSHRYIKIAEDKGLLVVRQSSYDRRVDLLCPTDLLIEHVRREIAALFADIANLQTAVTVVSTHRIDADWRHVLAENPTNQFLRSLGGAERLIADQKENEGDDFHESLAREIARYSETLRHAPHNKSALRRRAYEYNFTIQFDKALADCNAWIALDPSDPDAYALRAEVQYGRDAYSDSVADWNLAIERAPTRTDLFVGRAESFLAMQNYDNAISDLTKAIETQPLSTVAAYPHNGASDLVFSFQLRANAYEAKGDLVKAIADLELADQITPDKQRKKKISDLRDRAETALVRPHQSSK
jgi:tetratricopeptide (TPR) repeat protein